MILACSFERVARARLAMGQITRDRSANASIESLQSANGGWGAAFDTNNHYDY